jgi:hypothetical protein
MIDIQLLLNEMSDIRADLGRVRGTIGGMDAMLLGVTILLGINCVATIIIGIAIWNTNGG